MGKLRGLIVIIAIVGIIYYAYTSYQKKHAGEYDIDLSTYTLEMAKSYGTIVNFSEENGQYKYVVAFSTATQQNITFETKPVAAQFKIQDKFEMYVKSDTDYICLYNDEIIYASEDAVKNHKKGMLS